MPITIIPATHMPELHPALPLPESLDDLLSLSCPDAYSGSEAHVIDSSLAKHIAIGRCIYPSSSSLIRSAIEAWSRHSHLVIRPEIVWFTVIAQINCFIRANPQYSEHLFVPPDRLHSVTLEGENSKEALNSIHQLLQHKLRASWLSNWVSPGFSTSSEDDEFTAAILMMGSLREFDVAVEGGFACGIPSITLLGTKHDWQRLLQKVDRLKDFGVEPENYACRLRPLLSRFVRTFDSPSTIETEGFWNQMVQTKAWHCDKNPAANHPVGQYIISGWILGFYYWNEMGRVNNRLSNGWDKSFCCSSLKYDNISYGQASLEDLPAGYAKIAVKLRNDNTGEEELLHWMLAGNIAKEISNSAPEGFKKAADPICVNKTGLVYDAVKNDAESEKGDVGCLSSLFRNLSRKRRQRGRPNMQNNCIKQESHSTIQPMSAWFTYGHENCSLLWYNDVELSGPTVDAINSCERLERIRKDFGLDYQGSIREECRLSYVP